MISGAWQAAMNDPLFEPRRSERKTGMMKAGRSVWTGSGRLAAAALFLLLTAAQTPSAAAPGAPGAPTVPPQGEEGEEIVVTGTALSEAEARERATAFVRSTGVARGETPAARWVIPVCPRVSGLTVSAARSAEAKMRAIAAQAGIEVAREGCDANFIVSFVSDPRALVREVDRRAPRRLSEVPRGEKDALLNGPAPARWWYTTETIGRYGQRARHLPPPRSEGEPGGAGGGSVIPDVPSTMHYQSSQISTLSQRSIVSAAVVIDERAVVGMPLEAVAAYAALVGFAEIRDSDAKPEGSILSLFNSQAPPRDLTAQDRAFLRALYRIPMDRQAIRHRGNLVREMMAALTSEN
jgi:hypothetical protein